MRKLTDRENEILERTLRETLKERADALKTGPEDAERMCRSSRICPLLIQRKDRKTCIWTYLRAL